ncbi:hypothetical protein EYR38_001436 [Pleurotus pulmonarius]|nr:hypothetical protein EYR38_001436 [Pleurotus pulmonarius]
MAFTNAAIPFSTPGARPTLLAVGEIPSSVLIPMLPFENSSMEQLIASEASCQRTNQALIGTNVSTLLMAVLFFTYRYFKQAKPRTEKPIASDFDGYDIIHPIDEARVLDDGLHDVGQMSKETSTLHSAAIAHFPLHRSDFLAWRPRFFSKPWLWHTRDGDRSKEAAAEEGRTSLSPNNLPDSYWDTFLERGRNVFGTVSTLFKVYNQRNTGSVEARPFVAQEDESTKSPPLVTGDPLEIGDRRSPEQTPPASNPTQTTTASSNHNAGTEGSVTTTTASPRAHRHKELQKPFPFVPAPRIGSGTAPPSSFSGIAIQGTDPRGGLSRSTTASSDVSSVPSLPLYQHCPNNPEGSTSPTPSSAPSTYDPLRESIPPVPALPSAEGIATPTTLRAEGERIGLMSSNTLAKGHQRRTSGLASSRTSTMQSTWSDYPQRGNHFSVYKRNTFVDHIFPASLDAQSRHVDFGPIDGLRGKRTNQVLFGTNVTILIMAALFVTYHGFRKTMSRRSHSKLLADDSRGFGPSHTTVGGRLAGDELHNVVRESLDASPRSPGIGWVGEETLSSPVSTTSRIPLRGQHSAMWHSRFSKARWVLRTRGGGRFAEGAEEGRTLPTLNELSEIIGDCWYKLRAQGRDALASVSTLATKVSHRSNSNIGSRRPKGTRTKSTATEFGTNDDILYQQLHPDSSSVPAVCREH